MAKAKSRAAEDYRSAASAYLTLVRVQKNATLAQLARWAGAEAHTTVRRWIKMETQPDLAGLQLIADHSGMPLPAELLRLAKEARSPPPAEKIGNKDISPLLDRMNELVAAIREERDHRAREALRLELQELAAKIG